MSAHPHPSHLSDNEIEIEIQLSTKKRLPRRRSFLQSILQKPCFVTSVLLQNKQFTTLAENGEYLISAQPRKSAHSQGPKI